MIGGPSLLFDEGEAIGMGGDAPAMPVSKALTISHALCHERVLGADQAAFNLGRLIGLQSVKAAH